MLEWNAIDLHMHTVSGVTGDGGGDVVNFTYQKYIYSMIKYDIKLAAITNHNIIDMTNYLLLKYLSNKRGINLLLGVEFDADTDLGDNYHFVCLFNESSLCKCITLAENINNKANKKKKTKKVRFSGSEVIDLINNHNTIIVPHGDKDKGIFKDFGSEEKIKNALRQVKDGFVKVFDNRPSSWKLEKLKQYLTDNNVFKNIEDFGGVIFSDNRDWDNYGEKYRQFYMNAEPTFRGFLHSITNPEQRFSLKDHIPQKSNYISKMVIKRVDDKSKIAEGIVYFNSGYNCIIGKSGTGKSLLLYLVKKTLLPIQDNKDYEFAENSSIEFYDEKGALITPSSLNLGEGQGIINKILLASGSKDGNDMYRVIGKLKEDFVPRVKLDSFITTYKRLLTRYVSYKDEFNNLNKNTVSLLNVFRQENDELIKLKDIKVFSSFSIEEDDDYMYSNEKLSNICDINNQIESISENIKAYYNEDSISIITYFNLFKEAYYKKNKEILDNYLKIKYANNKKQILRSAFEIVNQGISSNAARKTKIQNGMDSSIDLIVKQIKKYHILKKALNKFDLSIKISDIDNKEILFENENIEIIENISPIILQKFDIKNNDLFYLYGIKASLLSSNYDITDKIDALKIINEYYEKGALTQDRINKFLEKHDFLNVDVYFDGKNVKHLNPGSIAKKYIDLYFNTKLNNGDYSVIVYDQIENDVDKEYIKDDIVKHIQKMKDKMQIIIVTHDPIIAVNADPTNYIISEKDNEGIIHYRNFVAESSIRDELETIANTVDGSRHIIKKRYDIYKGENDYVD